MTDDTNDSGDVSPAASPPDASPPDNRPPAASAFDDDAFDDDDEPEVVKTPVTLRGAAVVGGRVLAGVIAIASSVAVVAAASVLSLPAVSLLPTISVQPPSELVTPVPTAQLLACPGGALRLADETGQGATTASALGAPELDFASNTGQVDATSLSDSDASTGGTPAAPTLISTLPSVADPSAQVLVSGAQAELVDSGDYVGLLTASCATPSGDSWLVGGSTAVGRTTLLTLSNPSEVSAIVTVELFGERGAIVAPGTSGIVVAPQGQRVLSLAGFQPGVESPVVHVTSTGGQVVANLQQSIVRGLEPGGMDLVGESAPPSLRTVIPGVVLTDLAAVQELAAGGASFADAATALRLFAPGEGTVTAIVTIVPVDGVTGAGDTTVLGDSFSIDFEAGRVTDVPLETLGTGSYSVRVDTDQPAVAAVRVTAAVPAVAGGANDFAWLSSAQPLSGLNQFTVARGPSPTLQLVNPGESSVTVSLTELGSASAAAIEVTLAPRSAAAVSVSAGQSYLIDGAVELYASLSFADGAAIGGYPLAPPGVGSASVRVFL